MLRNSLIYLVILLFTASNACAVGITVGNGSAAQTVTVYVGNGTTTDAVDVYVGNGTAADCLNCASSVTYLINEDFAGFNSDHTGWYTTDGDGTITYNDGSITVVGGTARSYLVTPSFGDQSELYVIFKINITTFKDYGILFVYASGANTRGLVYTRSWRALYTAYDGVSNSSNTSAIPVTTDYYIKGHIVSAVGGSGGLSQIAISSDGTTWSAYSTSSGGTSALVWQTLRFVADVGHSYTIKGVKVATEDFNW